MFATKYPCNKQVSESRTMLSVLEAQRKSSLRKEILKNKNTEVHIVGFNSKTSKDN
jgi:hypothetical protein